MLSMGGSSAIFPETWRGVHSKLRTIFLLPIATLFWYRELLIVHETSFDRIPCGQGHSLRPIENSNMSTMRLQRARILLLCLFIGSHAPLIGCSDDSKTSGTQVVENPEAAAHRKAKGAAYKGGSPKKQQANGAVPKE
jgi:hypothetical protein